MGGAGFAAGAAATFAAGAGVGAGSCAKSGDAISASARKQNVVGIVRLKFPSLLTVPLQDACRLFRAMRATGDVFEKDAVTMRAR